MNWVFCSLNVMFLLDSVLGTLPTPSNLSVNSVNFLHILHWDPGPGTPPGVQYTVFSRLSGEKVKEALNDYTTATSLQLRLDDYKYYLTVQAFFNGTWSPESEEISFTPFEQTLIGPPKVMVTDCGNCILINISLPKADKSSGIPNNDILAFYKGKFRVLWKKSNKTEVCKTEASSVKIDNLETGKEYCVQIQTEITMNNNTKPSTWVCTFSSTTADLIRVPVPGTLIGLGIFCIGALMTLTYCLYHNGFASKFQATLPRALIIHAKSLAVEETSPDFISVCTDTYKQKCTIGTALYPAHRTTCSGKDEGEVDEEEENEGNDFYINRDGETSSQESSCRYSGDVLRTSLTVRSQTEADASKISSGTVSAELDQFKTGVENCTFLFQQPEMEVKEQLMFELEEEINENTVSVSENVNLSSVTLTAITICEKELVDSLRLSEPLMFRDTNEILAHTDLNDLTSTVYTCFGETRYESKCDDVETQDRLDEEQFLGYVRR
ncbi:uncharacterized protein ACBT44_014604 isoform 3-T4 [Syngnathus typhle]